MKVTDGRDGLDEKARDEFLAEAQELVDGLGRDLLELEKAVSVGGRSSDRINDLFRGVHSLKGIAGIFGAVRMAAVSHELEDLLDDLRLDRFAITPEVIDTLFRSIAVYGLILSSEQNGSPEPIAEVEAFVVSLGSIARRPGAEPSLAARLDIDPAILGVLTEYEEHRLRTCVQAGLDLFRVSVTLAITALDTELDDIKLRLSPLGEIISYLPNEGAGDIDHIGLDIFLATSTPKEDVDHVLANIRAHISIVERRRQPVDDREQSRSRDLSEYDTLPPPGDKAPVSRVAPSEPPSLRSASQSVRVDIRKLESLMNYVNELASVRGALQRLAEEGDLKGPELTLELTKIRRLFDRQLAQLQSGILEARLVPLSHVFDKLGRIVRQVSQDHDKRVNLVVAGSETEIDKVMAEELSDPLMHMVRNSIDHGIESREERNLAGKPQVGTIALNAFQKANFVVIEVQDDGRGIDPSHVLDSAISKGLVDRQLAAKFDENEILRLVFRSGFTTRTTVSDWSGRGVGLDVAQTNIASLGGLVDIRSELGTGTKITITIPTNIAGRVAP